MNSQILNNDFYRTVLDQIPGLIFVVDIPDSRFIYVNQYTAKLCGYESVDSALGITAHDMRCPAAECADEYLAQDRLVIQRDEELTLLDIHTYADNNHKMLLTKKRPLRFSGQIYGMICQSIELQSDIFAKVCSALTSLDKKYHTKSHANERTYTMDVSLKTNSLTKREGDCIYYLLRGCTNKQIAARLQLSPRTIETHMEKIKSKTGAISRSEITEYAIENGYLNYIPKNIIVKNFSSVLDQF